MGFIVRQSDNHNFGWINKALRPAGTAEPAPPGCGRRDRATVFATREEAQQEIDAIRQRDWGSFKFEIQAQ
jgi:hypothetical protein